MESKLKQADVKLTSMCSSKGVAIIQTKMDKTVYKVNENARLLANIDNSKAEVDCKALSLDLW